jgi:hypothetical protein
VEDIEVVLVKHIQQIEDGPDGEELSARVQHETSVRIEIGVHLAWISDGAEQLKGAARGVITKLRHPPNPDAI